MAFDSLDPFKKLRKPRRPLGTPTGMETIPRIASEEPLQRPRIVAQRPRVVSEAPTEDPNDYRSKLKPRPTFDVNGVVDPKYRTGRGSNALAGGAVGAQIGAQRNDPIFGIGATIGGMVAGLFKKNLAGKMQHQADVQEADEYNKELYASTMADERIQAMEQQAYIRDDENRRKAEQAESKRVQQEFDNKLKSARATNADITTLTKLAKETPIPSIRQQIFSEILKKQGIAHDQEDPDLEGFATSIKDIDVGGNIAKIDKWGVFRGLVSKEDGTPISNLNPKQEREILEALVPKEEGTTLDQALKQADEVLITHFNGKLTTAQRSSLKMRIAEKLLKEGQTASTTIDIQGIDVGAENPRGVYRFRLDQLGAPQTPAQSAGTTTQPTQETPKEADSPMGKLVKSQPLEKVKANLKDAKQDIALFKKQKKLSKDEEEYLGRLEAYVIFAEQRVIQETGESLPTEEKSSRKLKIPAKFVKNGTVSWTESDGTVIVANADTGEEISRTPKRKPVKK